MENTVQALSLILKMNDRLFINTLAGITDEQAAERVSSHNNPVRWLAPHTVSARYLMLLALGKPVADPYHDMFANFRGYDPEIAYPNLEETRAEWEKATTLLHQALESVSADVLSADAPFPTPIGDGTNLGLLAFMVHHECYDIGQLGYLKKYLTAEAMKY